MVRPICKDIMFLSQRSIPATPSDTSVIRDLRDTLSERLDGCVGMAANMIGVNKRVIAVVVGQMILVMVNPEIIKKSGAYEAEEVCLSLAGTQKTTRWQSIEVKWLDESFKTHSQTFIGFTAQIIQYEIDHCDGILIQSLERSIKDAVYHYPSGYHDHERRRDCQRGEYRSANGRRCVRRDIQSRRRKRTASRL